jgi:hypothetical protein
MFLKNTKIYYSENFLSNQDLEKLDSIIGENSEKIAELQNTDGGYKILKFDDSEFLDNLTHKVKELVVQEYGEIDLIYPRNEIQFLHFGTGMSPHDDGNGQPVKHGIVIYLSNPEDYVG